MSALNVSLVIQVSRKHNRGTSEVLVGETIFASGDFKLPVAEESLRARLMLSKACLSNTSIKLVSIEVHMLFALTGLLVLTVLGCE